MSLLPFLLYEMDRPRHHADQQLAVIPPDDMINLFAPMFANEFMRKLKQISSAAQDAAGSTIKCDKNKFQVNLDVQHFAPEEIAVKTADGYIIIEAKHEEKKDDHGWVSRQFVRRYPLPEGCNIDTVQSRLSSDGVLTVTAPLCHPQASNERIVPIVQTGPVKTRPEEAKFEAGDRSPSADPVENGD